jgi:hypothetical protein
MHPAARGGAVTNISFALKSMRAALRDCPTFKPSVDSKALRAASKLMTSSFSDYIEIHNAVGYSSELMSITCDKMQRNLAGMLALPKSSRHGYRSSRSSGLPVLSAFLHRVLQQGSPAPGDWP